MVASRGHICSVKINDLRSAMIQLKQLVNYRKPVERLDDSFGLYDICH